MTCLRRCTGHTDRRNSRRCSRSRRNSTPCRSYRYHSRRRSWRYSRRHSLCRSCRHSCCRRRCQTSHSCRCTGCRTSRRSSTCSRRCMRRHSWSRRYPNPGTCTHRCEQEGHTRQHTVLMGKREGSVGAGRPAAGATRSQLPPSVPAVDFARDRRVVRRERRRVVRLVGRCEDPAVGCGEHHREVDEHRVLWSLHLLNGVWCSWDSSRLRNGASWVCCVAKGRAQCSPWLVLRLKSGFPARA